LKIEGRGWRELRINVDMVKVLIDNFILEMKANVSKLAIQDIHDHLAEYILPESWHRNNITPLNL
jgi:hypothetical protein